MGRRRRWTVAAVTLLVALSGCTTLAGDPTIRPGLNVGRGQVDAELQVAPPGPRDGADPAEIVRGFVHSQAGSGGDFVTSREFLTGEALRTWSAETRTLVFRGALQVTDVEEPTPTPPPEGATEDTADDTAEDGPTESAEDAPTRPPLEAGDRVLSLSVMAWAEVDRLGHYRELPGTQQVTTEVVLARSAGQWRIRYLDPQFGRWLNTADFERLYDPYAVHYVSTGERVLMPDIRYVPTDRVATRLALLQLGETPDYLLGAVRHDIPVAAQLNVGAVPVLDGVATVDLKGEGIGSDPTARENLWAQFFATLTQVRGVDRVQITLEGNPLEIAGVEDVRSLGDLRFTQQTTSARATALVRQGNSIGTPNLRARFDDVVREPTTAPRSEQRFPWIDEEWRNLALSPSGVELAGTSADALSRWRRGTRYEAPRFATDLGRVCYDRHDVLWAGGIGVQVPRERLFAFNAAASPADPLRSAARPVAVSWLTDRRVLGCHVSPQGSRIALITDAGADTAPQLDIGAVVRTTNGLPIAVIGQQSVGARFASVTDAVWLNETLLGVLGRTHPTGSGAETAEDDPDDPDRLQPFLLTVGGRSVALPTLSGATRITSTGGERNLIVVTADEQIMVRVGPQWLPAVDHGSEVMVAGR